MSFEQLAKASSPFLVEPAIKKRGDEHSWEDEAFFTHTGGWVMIDLTDNDRRSERMSKAREPPQTRMSLWGTRGKIDGVFFF